MTNVSHITTILTQSKGVQWLLVAVAIILVIKVFKREIVATKCHFQQSFDRGSSNVDLFANNNVVEKSEEERKKLIVMQNRLNEEEPLRVNFKRRKKRKFANY